MLVDILPEEISSDRIWFETVEGEGAFYRDSRLVSIEGTTIDVAGAPVNAEVFGRPGTGRGAGSAFPQLRIVALGKCGTHAVIAAVMDSYAVVEQSLAKRIVPALRPGMLCLADRGFTRPTNAGPEPCCVLGPAKASTKKPGAICACTTPYVR